MALPPCAHHHGKVQGDLHPETAVSPTNLATIYCDQGRHTEAEPLCHRALDILEKRSGPSTPAQPWLRTS